MSDGPLLIVRDAMLGLRRFDDFLHSLGVARNVLAERLKLLVEAGVLERVVYQPRPQRFEYRLTAVGQKLGVPLIGLMQWGDRHRAGRAGPPQLARHRTCGGEARARLLCDRCGETVAAGDLELLPGPGLLPGQPRR